jgi:CheY-like chemotaxis protein
MMPGRMDGLDLCRLVKSDPSLGMPLVVLLTARGQRQDIEAGMKAGADAYLLKPFSPLKLIETIDSLVSSLSEAP